ncbi:MAG: hypothetical protein MZV70_37090 [Desulfobacterales bacterium]|nr:hypothetical protein [Desulfobacterales bacterium]
MITDIKMPRMDGYSLLKEIQNRYPVHLCGGHHGLREHIRGG